MSPLTITKNWVIIDTCTISNILKLEDERPLFNLVANNIGEFTPVITPIIRFEFLRQSRSKTEFEDFKGYLNDKYVEINLENEDDRYDIMNFGCECALIAKFANRNHHGGIQMADYIHQGLLRRYPRTFYMLTFDNNDFPAPVYDTVCHSSVDINHKLEVWSLKKFNQDKFYEYYERYKEAEPKRKEQ